MSRNGLRTFAVHRADQDPSGSALRGLAAAMPSPTANLAAMDDEAAARHHLATTLAATSLPAFEVPATAAPVEFRLIGTDTIPFSTNRSVKFRELVNSIPVYGSIVTIEMDERKQLVALNSALGEAIDVTSAASVSPAAAIDVVRKHAQLDEDAGAPPARLFWYHDDAALRWRLAYIIEAHVTKLSVPPAPMPVDPRVARLLKRQAEQAPPPDAGRFDFIVDAHDGNLVRTVPKTMSIASDHVATDGLGGQRSFTADHDGERDVLFDPGLGVRTHDFGFRDARLQRQLLPGTPFVLPPAPWNPAAVSAHANASDVARFFTSVLQRRGLDGFGEHYVSSVWCSYNGSGKEWRNAAWNGSQMIYGQRNAGPHGYRSYALAADVVGHEIVHGITERTADMEYLSESGALNESYSDIFGVLIFGSVDPDPRKWEWELGRNLEPSGVPLRSLENPQAYDQPAHMNDYVQLPEDGWNDWGGVHVNSGIHNHAAFRMLTTVDANNQPLFTRDSASRLFYGALVRHLSRTSRFSDSRRALVLTAKSELSAGGKDDVVRAIEDAFDAVGIQ